MDKAWLYVGGIMLAMAVAAYVAISTVKNVSPPANDLRAAYDKAK